MISCSVLHLHTALLDVDRCLGLLHAMLLVERLDFAIYNSLMIAERFSALVQTRQTIHRFGALYLVEEDVVLLTCKAALGGWSTHLVGVHIS